MLNFDWRGVGDDESSEALFSCPHFLKMMERLRKAKAKLGTSASYYEASSVSELKFVFEEAGVKVDLDRMLAAEIGRKSAEIVVKNGGKRRHRTGKAVVK